MVEEARQALQLLEQLRDEAEEAIGCIQQEQTLAYGRGGALLGSVEKMRSFIDAVEAIARDPAA
jgi:hypothetical protein